jgi:SNF2 family DNA or RNA helicase
MTDAVSDLIGTFNLRPFQEEDYNWLLDPRHSKNMVLYDRGLGKTVIATRRNIEAGVGTSQVICPGNARGTWEKHTKEWYSHFYPGYDVDVFKVEGTPAKRKKIWDELLHPERTRQKRQFICTYHTIVRDAKNILSPRHLKAMDQIDMDEAHKLRNRKSQNFKALQPILRNHEFFSFLTGTPISRGPQEFWTYLNCINPKYFSSYWRHVGQFCEVIDGFWGKEIIGPRNLSAHNHLLQQYARVRSLDDPEISAQMPKSSRVPVWCTMDNEQASLYLRIQEDKEAFTPDGKLILGATSMEQMIRFRQLLVCPRIFSPELGLGAAFENFLDIIEDGDINDKHTVIFTPFKSAFKHFRAELERRKYLVFELSGGITDAERDYQIAQWRGHQGIMLCTIPYAESFSLEPSKYSHFIGYEWDQNANIQAEGRLRRLTTTYPVTHHYYRFQGTVEDGQAHVVDFKSSNVQSTMQGARQ